MNDIYKQNLHNLEQAMAKHLDPDCHCACDGVPKRIIAGLSCDYCGEEIKEGEQYLNRNRTLICDKCLEDMNAKLLIEVLELEMEEA